jgi:hypothetical protein
VKRYKLAPNLNTLWYELPNFWLVKVNAATGGEILCEIGVGPTQIGRKNQRANLAGIDRGAWSFPRAGSVSRVAHPIVLSAVDTTERRPLSGPNGTKITPSRIGLVFDEYLRDVDVSGEGVFGERPG